MNVLGVDLGAAFVDLAIRHGGCTQTVKKAFARLEGGEAILAAIDAAMHEWGIEPAALDRIHVGSTGAVNMLLTRRGARVGLITTDGFGDTLALGRQNRAELYDPVARSPSPTFLVEPGCVHEVGGRLDASGTEVEPLAVNDVEAAAASLAEKGVESVAVCLLFSYLEPMHELACADILRHALPDIPICLSHEIDASPREYERTVSTCLEAWLKPSQTAAMEHLEQGLASRGFRGLLAFADSRGHLMEPPAARRRIISQIASGPAASAQAAATMAGHTPLALALDIGSVSTDMVLIEAGNPRMTNGATFAGVPLRLRMTDVESTSIGGGSIATWSPGGGLRLHPTGESGAPTLTDALVVLGRIPRDIAPGAHARVEMLASRSGSNLAMIAEDVVAAAADSIAAALLAYAARRNVDPACAALAVTGGLGALLATSIADRLGTRRVLAAPASAAAGALGLLSARHAVERRQTVRRRLAELDDASLKLHIESLVEAVTSAPGEMVFSVEIAPDPHMHPMLLGLGSARPTTTVLRRAFAHHYAGHGETPAADLGFVFSLGVEWLHDRVASAPALHDSPPGWEPQLELLQSCGWRAAVSQHGIVVLSRPDTPRPGSARTLQMRLDAIAQAMQETLFRTAVSPVVREGNDAAAALLTPMGEIMALSDSIPLLLGALDGSVKAILDTFPPEGMVEGDFYFMNDPYFGGTHLPDITVAGPVFADSRLIGIAATILHHQDIGGMRAGSVPPDATDIHQEGLRLPPMRLGSAGRIAPDIIRLLRSNSRTPDTLLGDLGSQIAALGRAGAALRRLAEDTGVHAFPEKVAECLDIGEEQARQAIGGLAACAYLASDGLDTTPGAPALQIELALRFERGVFKADFTGTSPQVEAPVNCVRSGPLAAALYSLLCIMGPDAMRNGGVVRTLDLVLPQACVVNASPPAAVNARMGIVRAATSAFLQALASALPHRMPAANSGMSYVLAFSGRDAQGMPFVSTEIIAGGAGGGPDSHGAPGISTDVGNAMNMPAEALESAVPIRLVSASIRRGSGGAGRYRGGDGIRRVYEALADGIAVSLRGERFTRVPPGLAGGGSPKPSFAAVERAAGATEILSSRSAQRLNKGDRLIVESCGGAGYGSEDKCNAADRNRCRYPEPEDRTAPPRLTRQSRQASGAAEGDGW